MPTSGSTQPSCPVREASATTTHVAEQGPLPSWMKKDDHKDKRLWLRACPRHEGPGPDRPTAALPPKEIGCLSLAAESHPRLPPARPDSSPLMLLHVSNTERHASVLHADADNAWSMRGGAGLGTTLRPRPFRAGLRSRTWTVRLRTSPFGRCIYFAQPRWPRVPPLQL